MSNTMRPTEINLFEMYLTNLTVLTKIHKKLGRLGWLGCFLILTTRLSGNIRQQALGTSTLTIPLVVAVTDKVKNFATWKQTNEPDNK